MKGERMVAKTTTLFAILHQLLHERVDDFAKSKTANIFEMSVRCSVKDAGEPDEGRDGFCQHL